MSAVKTQKCYFLTACLKGIIACLLSFLDFSFKCEPLIKSLNSESLVVFLFQKRSFGRA